MYMCFRTAVPMALKATVGSIAMMLSAQASAYRPSALSSPVPLWIVRSLIGTGMVTVDPKWKLRVVEFKRYEHGTIGVAFFGSIVVSYVAPRAVQREVAASGGSQVEKVPGWT